MKGAPGGEYHINGCDAEREEPESRRRAKRVRRVATSGADEALEQASGQDEDSEEGLDEDAESCRSVALRWLLSRGTFENEGRG